MLDRKAESPRDIAAAQPHRRGLGDKAVSQLAESVLGRMFLREHIGKDQLLAGQEYARRWSTYQAVIDGPRGLLRREGAGVRCHYGYCDGQRCWCERVKAKWEEARNMLREQGYAVYCAVGHVAIFDVELDSDRVPLLIGLNTLARHFGLTKLRKRGYRNASSRNNAFVGTR